MSPSRRADIRMSEAEADEFIRSQWCMVVGPNGWPHLATLGYGFYEGKLAFSSFARAQKVVNIQRDPRVNCLIEVNQADYDQIAGVSILGRAEIVRDPDAALAVARSVLAQRLKQANGGAADEAAIRLMEASAALAAKRVAITVDVNRILSWDHRRLSGRY
jgi:nitroimidazol reductase NimA-like FMN-containing flavoprotein (pyridoxamine 5'-phosphate oxidase superfamily)